MCRHFAFFAYRPADAAVALLDARHSLRQQSCCDLRGECHPSGWGIGYYRDGHPVRVRSVEPASADPLYESAARAAVSRTVLGHVRQASVGGVAPRNTHPFVFGRWLFAHNGTLQGFATNPDPLRRLIPDHLAACVEGETDSEHLFYFLLGSFERVFGDLRLPPPAGRWPAVIGPAIRKVATLYPGTDAEPSRLNVLLSDGTALAATRWVHTLHLLEARGPGIVNPYAPSDPSHPFRAVCVASEPIGSADWQPVSDHSLLIVGDDLGYALAPLG